MRWPLRGRFSGMMLQRTHYGRAGSGKRRGKRGGRPYAIGEEKMAGIREAIKKEASRASICRTFGVKRRTLHDGLGVRQGEHA